MSTSNFDKLLQVRFVGRERTDTFALSFSSLCILNQQVVAGFKTARDFVRRARSMNSEETHDSAWFRTATSGLKKRVNIRPQLL